MVNKNNAIVPRGRRYSKLLSFCLSQASTDQQDTTLGKLNEQVYNFAMLQAHRMELAHKMGGLERMDVKDDTKSANIRTGMTNTEDSDSEIFLMPEIWYDFAASFSKANGLGEEKIIAARKGEYGYYMDSQMFDDAMAVSRRMLGDIGAIPPQMANEFYVCAAIDRCNRLVEKCRRGDADWNSAISAAMDTHDELLIEDVSLMGYEFYMDDATKLIESGNGFLVNAAAGYETALHIARETSMHERYVFDAAVKAYSAYSKEVARGEKAIAGKPAAERKTDIYAVSHATMSAALLAEKYGLGAYNVVRYAKEHFAWELETVRYGDRCKHAFEWATQMRLDADFVVSTVRNTANALSDEGLHAQAGILFDEMRAWKSR